jgi:hypothetical protein
MGTMGRLACGVGAVAVAASAGRAQGACRGRDDVHAQFLLGVGRTLAASADANVVGERVSMRVPAAPEDSVTLVADERVCAAAARAYAAAVGGRSPDGRPLSGRVYVVRVGGAGRAVYLVVDPAWRAGEWGAKLVMSEAFAVLSRSTF